jgi:hypothetical protein
MPLAKKMLINSLIPSTSREPSWISFCSEGESVFVFTLFVCISYYLSFVSTPSVT